jgi:dipeptidyl aminopeptidase/acylaminoacyl peptidase
MTVDRVISLVACSFLLLALPPALAAPHTLDELLQPVKAEQIQISPDGKKIAVVSHEEGRRVLALMTLEPLAITYVLRFVDGQEVGEVYWVNDDRLVTTVWRKQGWLDSPHISGYLYALNYDGRRQKAIFGYEIGYDDAATASRIKKQEIQAAHASIISTLPKDKSHILISTYPWERRGHYWQYTGETIGEVLKLHVYSGRTKKLMSLPTRGGQAFADDDGEVHFARGTNVDGVEEFFWRHDGQWRRLGEEGKDQLALPVGYSADRSRAYLISKLDSDTSTLTEMNLETAEQRPLFNDPRVDISDVVHHPGTHEPMALYLDNGRPTTQLLHPEHSSSRLLAGLQKAFPEHSVRVESVSRDGKVAVVAVSGDNKPVDFYLVKLDTRDISLLISSASWLDPRRLAKTEPFDLPARDGLLVQGYLTFPPGPQRNLPLVVVPHGGPSARDYWGFQRERQILAAAGYLVMQVNFRGSSGYGTRFQSLSDGVWGSAVQDDITDATRWVLEQGYADASRVCIYGASFGAYSALMGVIREPALYRCAAGFAGVYDLEMMYKRGDIPARRAGVAYLTEVLGTDADRLQRFSPVHNAGSIKVPVFIAHGEEDQRAPVEQARALEAALAKAGVPVSTRYYEKGGHGYYSPAANRKLYGALLDFLATHIGVR